MGAKQVPLRLPEDIVAAIDTARGDVPRVRWILRAIEARLGGEVRFKSRKGE